MSCNDNENHNLMNELTEKSETYNTWFREKFKNPTTEEEFHNFKKQEFDKASITICILIVISELITSICLRIISYYNYVLYLSILFILVDIFLLILYFKINSNSSKRDFIKYLKFFLNLLFFYWSFFSIAVFQSIDKRSQLITFYLCHSILLILEYLFLLRISSKFICIFIYIGYTCLYFFATFSTTKISLVLDNKTYLSLEHECNIIMPYKEFNKEEKFSTIQFLSLLQNKTNSSEPIDFELEDYFNDHGEVIYTDLTEKMVIINNYTFSGKYLELIREDSISLTNQCFIHFHSDFISFLFKNFPQFNINLFSETKHFKFIIEICSCFASMFFYYISMYLNNYKKEIFNNMKDKETIMNYFELMIKNMQTQFVSISKDKVLLSNKAFDNKVIESPSIKRNSSINTINSHCLLNSEVERINIPANPEVHSSNNKEEAQDEGNASNLKNKQKSSINLQNYSLYKSNSHEYTFVKNYFNELYLEKPSQLFSKILNINIDTSSSHLTIMSSKRLNLSNILEIINNQCCQKHVDNELEMKANSFEALGTFISINKYYKVFIRKFNYKIDKFLLDIMIDDITEIKQAERTSFETKLKQKLFSKMAHEFKTPLIVIKSLITDLNDPSLVEKQRISAYIYYLSDYISFLINDIIYYSSNKNVKIQFEEINLFEIIDFCEGVTESLLAVMPGDKHNVHLRTEFDVDLILKYSIKSDKTRLKQILLNLLSNSAKFTKCGEIVLKVEVIFKNDVPYIKFIVEDTGIGIKDVDLKKIKNSQDKMLMINTEYAYNQMGTGLGLGIIKMLSKAMNHEFNICSTFGKGTQASIIISAEISTELNKTITTNQSGFQNTIKKSKASSSVLLKNCINSSNSLLNVSSNKNSGHVKPNFKLSSKNISLMLPIPSNSRRKANTNISNRQSIYYKDDNNNNNNNIMKGNNYIYSPSTNRLDTISHKKPQTGYLISKVDEIDMNNDNYKENKDDTLTQSNVYNSFNSNNILYNFKHINIANTNACSSIDYNKDIKNNIDNTNDNPCKNIFKQETFDNKRTIFNTADESSCFSEENLDSTVKLNSNMETSGINFKEYKEYENNYLFGNSNPNNTNIDCNYKTSSFRRFKEITSSDNYNHITIKDDTTNKYKDDINNTNNKNYYSDETSENHNETDYDRGGTKIEKLLTIKMKDSKNNSKNHDEFSDCDQLLYLKRKEKDIKAYSIKEEKIDFSKIKYKNNDNCDNKKKNDNKNNSGDVNNKFINNIKRNFSDTNKSLTNNINSNTIMPINISFNTKNNSNKADNQLNNINNKESSNKDSHVNNNIKDLALDNVFTLSKSKYINNINDSIESNKNSHDYTRIADNLNIPNNIKLNSSNKDAKSREYKETRITRNNSSNNNNNNNNNNIRNSKTQNFCRNIVINNTYNNIVNQKFTDRKDSLNTKNINTSNNMSIVNLISNNTHRNSNETNNQYKNKSSTLEIDTTSFEILAIYAKASNNTINSTNSKSYSLATNLIKNKVPSSKFSNNDLIRHSSLNLLNSYICNKRSNKGFSDLDSKATSIYNKTLPVKVKSQEKKLSKMSLFNYIEEVNMSNKVAILKKLNNDNQEQEETSYFSYLNSGKRTNINRSSTYINKDSIHTNPLSKYLNQNDSIISMKRKKILIVDDTEAIRKSLYNLLNRNPYVSEFFTIIEAKDGVDILNLVIKDQTEGNTIKIIITDENMEYMSGSSAIAIIRQFEKENKVPHIYIASLTAFTDDETTSNILKKGADTIVTKPISKKDVNDLIDKFKNLKQNDI